MAMVFGSVMPCRTCRTTGQMRNPELGDEAAARERARRRRHGEDVEPPPRRVTCSDCAGRGFVPAAPEA